jgi:hypothetical protein
MSDYNQDGGYPPQTSSNGLAVASLVVGIIALLLALIPVVGLISWILAPAGLIMGFLAINKAGGRGLAIGGLVTSGIALLVCILWVVGMGALMSASAAGGY